MWVTSRRDGHACLPSEPPAHPPAARRARAADARHRARAVRRARLRRRHDGRGRRRRRRHQAAALRLLRQQGAALPRVHGARRRGAVRDRRSRPSRTPTRPPTRCAAACTPSSRSWTPTARRGGCCTTRRCPPAARSPSASPSTARGCWRSSRSEPRAPARAAPRRARAEVEAISVALLGAAEALGRWWLRTGAMPAAERRRALDRTIEPGLANPRRRGHAHRT